MESLRLVFKLFWAPREVLAAVAGKPKVLAPLIFILLFSVTQTATVFSRIDQAEILNERLLQKGVADKISAKDRAEIVKAAQEPMVVALAFVASALRPVVIAVFVSAISFACFTLLGRETGFKAFLSVTAFSFLPFVINSIVVIVALHALPPTTALLGRVGSLGPAMFLNPESVPRLTYVGFGLLDVTSIWILALLVLGYGFVLPDRVSVTKRTVVVVGMWLVYAGLRLALAEMTPL